MLLYLLSRIVSSTGAFLYPTYASYKTLSRRPASEQDLERWLMYWSVLGTIVGLEYVAEWTISWIPFYHPFKTLFLLYLALPQTRGASYIYTTHFRPFLTTHESDIDATLIRMREQVYLWVQQRVRKLWDHFVINTELGAPDVTTDSAGTAVGAMPPPSQHDPVSGTAQLVYGLWRSYGPAILASGAALFQLKPLPQSYPASAMPDTPPAVQRGPESPPSYSQVPSSQTEARGTTSSVDVHRQDTGVLLARRRALEAELASLPLPDQTSPPPAFPIPHPVSSTYLSAQGDERGRYEEIARDEVDVDVVGEERPGAARRTSWWWGSGRSNGYERVKTE